MSDSAREKGPHRGEFNIVVNGRAKKVDEHDLTFEEVVKLAYPAPPAEGDIIYTVVFHNAEQEPKNGTLVVGQSVTIRNGTSFDVKHAVRS